MGLFRLEEITVSKKLVNLVLNFHRNISSPSGGRLRFEQPADREGILLSIYFSLVAILLKIKSNLEEKTGFLFFILWGETAAGAVGEDLVILNTTGHDHRQGQLHSLNINRISLAKCWSYCEDN